MLLNVATPNAHTQTAARSRVFFAMVYIAKPELQEVVPSARRCGIFFNCMPELAKNQSAVYHVAGVFSSFVVVHVCSYISYVYIFTCAILQGSEGSFEEVTTAV